MATNEEDPSRIAELATEYLKISDPEEKEQFLDETCGRNEFLRPAVLKLAAELYDETLAASEHDDTGGPTSVIMTSVSVGHKVGSTIGPYKLVKVLGQGGFGVVYEAKQTEPVKRTVALKVIKPGMDSEEVIARFDAERQALAMMDHPNIARVYEAGTSDSGHPYFAMELCHGTPLTQYCDKHNLKLSQRLELFLTVCRAVQHAHQKTVIHRDIKPSNILVSEQDGKPVPKVIDFGIAKALNQDLTNRTINTGVGMVIGTPQYMSPEQAAADPNDVDTRSDVYSLGIVLYELLTGSTPLKIETLHKLAVDEMLKHVREAEPIKPSSRIWDERDTKVGQDTATHRMTNPSRLHRIVRGELDWILLKALENDRDRRYESVAALAEDIENFQHHDAVSATPPSFSYRMRKFARKYRAPLLTSAALFIALLAGAIVSVTQAVRADRARQEAEAVTNFLVSTFQSPDPYRDGQSITVAEMLDEAASQVHESFADSPKVRSRLLDTIGRTYSSLGLDEQAAELHAENAELLREATFSSASGRLTADYLTGRALTRIGRWQESVPLLEKTGKDLLRTKGANHELTLACRQALASAYATAGRYEDAVSLLNEVVTIREKQNKPYEPSVLLAREELANTHFIASDYESAAPIYESVLEARRANPDHRNQGIPEVLSNLADTYQQLGREEEAEALVQEALDLSVATFGDDHQMTYRTRTRFAMILSENGENERAVMHLEESVAGLKNSLGLSHHSTLDTMRNLAVVLGSLGWHDKAVENLQAVTEASTALLGSDNPSTLHARNSLAIALVRTGKYEEAEKIYRDTLEHWITTQGENYAETVRVRQNLGGLYFDYMNRRGEAVTQQEHALESIQRIHGEKHPKTLLARSILGRYHGVLGNTDATIETLEPIINELVTQLPDHIEVPRAALALATAYDEAGRTQEAEVLFLQAVTTSRVRFDRNPGIREPVNPIRAMQALIGHYRAAEESAKVDASTEELKTLRREITEKRQALASTAPARDKDDRDMVFRVQIDGTSFLYLKTDQLWLSHVDGIGSPAGKHNGHFPTSVDRKDWMPSWKNKVTAPLNLPSLIPFDEDDFAFSAEVLSGRGKVFVLEQPSKNNDYTAKLELSDLTDDGVRIFGHDWLVFELSW
ncbi:MAG: serine/threonine protein kinase [Verrucomicrobiales bacterium]|nr:serine/threonine protein kinase [Verrucomicrobiales bacterium]